MTTSQDDNPREPAPGADAGTGANSADGVYLVSVHPSLGALCRRPWEVPGRFWRRVKAQSITDNLFASMLLTLMAAIGVGMWYMSEGIESARAVREVWQGFRIDRYQQKRQAYNDFADGIPRNATYLMNMRYMTLWVNGVVADGTDPTPTYYNGRSFDQVVDALEEEQRLWLQHCPHYTSLCESVRSQFSADVGALTDIVRRSFDTLNEIGLDAASQRRLTDAMLLRASDLEHRMARAQSSGLGIVEPNQLTVVRSLVTDLQATRDALERESVNSHQTAFQLLQACMGVIDQAYLLAVRTMGEELRTLPVVAEDGWLP